MTDQEWVIRIVDLETTSTAPPGEVCEVGYCDLTFTGGQWSVGEPVSWLCGVLEIPPETQAVHHIAPEDVAGLPAFDVASFVESSSHVALFAAHNAAFEQQWIDCDIPSFLCTYKAALRVWPEAPAHNNGTLRYWLARQGLLTLEHEKAMPPHRAGPDAYVTAHVLKALLTRATGREMVAWTREPCLYPTCPIGKEWRGKPWAEVDAGFLGWMLRQPDMEADLHWNAQRELDRRKEAS
jgi:exodeoxyribonuclease X